MICLLQTVSKWDELEQGVKQMCENCRNYYGKASEKYKNAVEFEDHALKVLSDAKAGKVRMCC